MSDAPRHPEPDRPATADDTLDEVVWIQATRLVAGQLEADEAAHLRQWLSAHEGGARDLREVERVWQAIDDRPPIDAMDARMPSWDVDSAMARFISAREAAPRTREVAPRRWWPAAAAAAVLIGTLAMWRTGAPTLSDESGTAGAPLALSVPAGASPRAVTLTDGSRVLVAPGSTLRSRGDFGGAVRDVELTGEAHFTVAAGQAPFVVYAAGVRIEDVSTAFMVRVLPHAALVAVTDGEVRVGASRTSLQVGEAVIAEAAGTLDTLDLEAARRSVAWLQGGLAFTNERADAVIERLARWTALDLTVDPTLASRRLSVAFDGESSQRMLDIVAQTLGARLEQRGSAWVIAPAARP